MERFKKMLPTILLLLFEIAVGIMLLINPKRFTIGVFIIFGVVLMLCACVMLIRYLKARQAVEKAASEANKAAKKNEKNGEKATAQAEPMKVSTLPLISAAVTFILGALFAFGSGVLYDWTALLVIFYGAIMIIKGIFKITDYLSMRKAGGRMSILRLIIGVLSIALGVVMIIFNKDARDTIFTIAAISLLVEAGLDIITLLMGISLSKKASAKVVQAEGTEKDGRNYLDDYSK